MKQEAIIASAFEIQKISIGIGSGYSETIGAKNVKNRAKKLVIPKAVPTKRVGKRLDVPIYAMLKFIALPKFAKSTKIGIHST